MTTVLVIDDISSELQLLKSLMDESGYQTDTAISGEEALNKVQENPPDVIVADLVMPEMSGLELCRKLKKNSETANIPFIACTTKDRQIDQKWAKKQGVAVYLVKPCTQEQLVNAVESVLS